MKRDAAHEATDKILEELEKKLRKEYRQAVKETQAKLDDYLRRFEIKDQKWQEMVKAGKRTEEEYKKWRLGQIAAGKRWETLRDQLAKDYHNANVIARSYVDGTRAKVYAENFNFSTYETEILAKVDTSFTLVNEDAVARIIREDPDLLPPPGKKMTASLAAGKDVAWQAGQIQSVMTQAILQGESIPHIAERIATTMGETNHASTIRYARTATTAAENAGREDSYRRAEEMGVDLQRMWQAVLDGRTRHEHRVLDGQIRNVDEPFEVEGEEIMFPGDPSAPGYLIWNCRCRTRAVVKGLEPMARKYRKIEGDLTYEEWKAANPTRSDKITKQEEIAELMRRRYVQEYYGGSGYGAKWKISAPIKAPDFSTMDRKQLLAFAESSLETKFVGTKGANEDFLRAAVSVIAEFETKLGGKTIDGLSVKFGGTPQAVYAKYDDKATTLLLKKTGSIDKFEEKLREENARYHIRWDTTKDYHATTTFSGTIWHELAHAVDVDSGQTLSRRLSASQALDDASVRVSSYAGTTQSVRVTKRSEAWAENFAAYMDGGPNKEKVPSEIVEIIEDWLKKKKKR